MNQLEYYLNLCLEERNLTLTPEMKRILSLYKKHNKSYPNSSYPFFEEDDDYDFEKEEDDDIAELVDEAEELENKIKEIKEGIKKLKFKDNDKIVNLMLEILEMDNQELLKLMQSKLEYWGLEVGIYNLPYKNKGESLDALMVTYLSINNTLENNTTIDSDVFLEILSIYNDNWVNLNSKIVQLII